MHNSSPATGDYPHISTPSRPLGTFVSLYAGAGGLDVGLSLAGFAPVWVNEFDPFAFITHERLRERMAFARPHLRGEMTAVRGDIDAISDDSLPVRGSADLVAGGPPCQGFSVAGKMDPSDPRSQHVFTFFRIVERVQPKAFILENVKNLYSNEKWAGTRAQMLARARELGYATEMYLLNASHFGVPQARERMFMIGVLPEHGEPTAPTPTTADRPPTVRQALATLPPFGQPGNNSLVSARITMVKQPVLRRSPYAGMLFNGAGRPLDLDRPSATIAASMGGNKTPIIEQNLVEDPFARSWVRELHARLSAGGDTRGMEPPSYLRRMTVQEASAIQTFPADLDWAGPQSRQFRQIGNAVPPLLGYAVGEAVARALGLSLSTTALAA